MEKEVDRREANVKKVGTRRVMWFFFVSQFPNVANAKGVFFHVDSDEEGSENGAVSGALRRPGASHELIESSSLFHECEFFGLDSDEDVFLLFLLCLALLWLRVVPLGVLRTAVCLTDSVCKDTTRFSQSDTRSRTRTGRRTVSKFGHVTSKEMGNKSVPSRTSRKKYGKS